MALCCCCWICEQSTSPSSIKKRFHFWDSSSSPGEATRDEDEADDTLRLAGCSAAFSALVDETADTSEADSSETPDVASESCPFVLHASRTSGTSGRVSFTTGGGAGAFLFFTDDDNEAFDVLDT